MTTENDEAARVATSGDPQLARSDTKAVAERLRKMVRMGGGRARISEMSGVPMSTLDVYLRTGGMKFQNAVALARAGGVRLEWLATGHGRMSVDEVDDPLDPPTGDEPASEDDGADATRARPTLFSMIDADRLGLAYVAALKALREAGHSAPDPRRVMQVTVLLYDQMTGDD